MINVNIVENLMKSAISMDVDFSNAEECWNTMLLAVNEEKEEKIMDELHRDFSDTTTVNIQPVDVKSLLSIDDNIGIKCPNKKCGKKDVRYVLIANRSADEGMTADCECRQCGKRFRISV